MILLDTNILIEILKGDRRTIEKVESLNERAAISAISAMELYFGARDKAEMRKLERFVSLFEIIHLNYEISTLAMKLIQKYAKSHTLDIPDGLIAATALTQRCRLFTYNRKDFRYIEGLMLF